MKPNFRIRSLPWSLLPVVVFMNISINSFEVQRHVRGSIEKVVNDEIEGHGT